MEDQNQTIQPSPQNINPLPPQNLPTPEAAQPLSKADRFKRIFFQVLIGCLLAAAAIAVVTVLVGSFNDTLGRSLGTIAMVATRNPKL